jgi:prepilin-type N-terminal cleavage/methylation domain-containing protein/prepilin-type processing-associated H-X9-DG protein
MCSARLSPPPLLSSRRSSSRRAFTLVELLVVIGIIAVLVSILLPTLRSVRRQANLVQCSSNMKQLSMAMLMYIQDNKGKFPAAEFFPIAGAYPYGWGWANELVAQNYIKAPGLSVYKFPGDTVKKFNRNNVFRCPEGIDEDAGFAGQAGDYPTDPRNNAPRVTQDTGCKARGFGIASWYQLNCRNTSATNGFPNGSRITPFMGFQSGSTDNMPLIKAPEWQRNLSMVKKAAELLMIVEAADQNWYDQTERSPGNFLCRLGARHGKKTADGKNAWTNMAFFDGHVGLYASVNFEHRLTDPTKGDQPDYQVKDVIFYINKQKGF